MMIIKNGITRAKGKLNRINKRLGLAIQLIGNNFQKSLHYTSSLRVSGGKAFFMQIEEEEFVLSRETVGMIFEAAVKVFAERGYDRAKMDEIARAAGVAKGTIYYHFTSKDELFTALMNHGLQNMKEYVRRRIDEEQDPTLKLRGLLDAEVSYLFQHGTFAKLLLTEVWSTSERQHEFRAHIHDLESITCEVLKVGIQMGQFREMDAIATSIAIFGAMSVSVIQKVFKDAHLTGEELANKNTAPVVATLEALVHRGILKN